MELRQIRYFVKVAELKSFSDAAKTLYISQSTLSQQVKQLEEELGVPLLNRDSHHVTTNDFGEQFLPYATKVIQDAESCITRIKDVQNLNVGTLVIGATYSFWPVLKETVKSFMQQYPGIKLDIICSSMEELICKLEKKEIDLALSFKPSQRYEHIESHILFTSNLCIIASADNALAKNSKIRLAELERYPLALPAKGLQARDTFDSLLYGQNFKFDVRLEINDIQVLLDMIRNSDMVTVLSQTTVNNDSGLKSIVLDNPGSEMIGSFHILKGTYCKKVTKFFLKQLIENNSFNRAMETLEI